MDGDTVALLDSPGAKTAHQFADDALRLVIGDGARRVVDVHVDLYALALTPGGDLSLKAYRLIVVIVGIGEDIGNHVGGGHRHPGRRFEDHREGGRGIRTKKQAMLGLKQYKAESATSTPLTR